MTTGFDEQQRKSLRTAGFWYFLMTISAPIGLLYVPSKLVIPGDAATTVELVRASESLFRLGIASELFHQVVAVFLALALYHMFRPVNENQAKLLVIFGALVSVPIMFLNVLNELAALILLRGADFLSSFEKNQLDSLAFLFIRLHELGIEIASIFWGLWLLPFGILIIRSVFVPGILGYLLFLTGSAYVVAFFASLLLPQYTTAISQVALILEIGELPTVFWFLIRAIWPPLIIEPGSAAS